MSRSRLVMALVVAVIAVLGYFGNSVFNPITQEKQHVAGITPEQEVALGLQAAPEMMQQFGGPDPDPEAQALVKRVGERLVSRTAAAQSPYRFEFHLLDDPETINAFALPGGQVAITEGLLRKLQTEGQLAGVLGHEIGHVVAPAWRRAHRQAAADRGPHRRRGAGDLRSRTIPPAEAPPRWPP